MTLCTILMILASAAGGPSDDLDAMDFDLFGDTEDILQQEERFAPADSSVKLRRNMLTTHHVFGLLTLAAMAATSVLGELNMQDVYIDGGAGTGRYLLPHRIAAYSTTILFLTTASLSLFAPTPYESEERSGFDTGTIHRIAVSVASVGMLAQLALGFIAARHADSGNPNDLGTVVGAHRVVGYSTLGALAVASAVWVF